MIVQDVKAETQADPQIAQIAEEASVAVARDHRIQTTLEDPTSTTKYKEQTRLAQLIMLQHPTTPTADVLIPDRMTTLNMEPKSL